MYTYIQTKFEFSNYQMAQLVFIYKTLLSESSKILILGILFHKTVPAYLTALIILCLLRICTGGIHCKTYWACFLTSFIYLYVAIKIFPLFMIPNYIQLLMLGICIIINYKIGPVTSTNHLPLDDKTKRRLANMSFYIIFAFLVFSYLFPIHSITMVGLGVIILHTLQLTVSYILMKRRQQNENS